MNCYRTMWSWQIRSSNLSNVKNSRKLFIFFVIVFVVLLAYASYDISQRTTFPGSKPQLKERINSEILENVPDSVTLDSAIRQ